MAVFDQFRAVERQIGKRDAVQTLRAVRKLPPHLFPAVGAVYAIVLRLEATFGVPHMVRRLLSHTDHHSRTFANSSFPASRARSVTPPPRTQPKQRHESVAGHTANEGSLDAQSGSGQIPTHLSPIRRKPERLPAGPQSRSARSSVGTSPLTEPIALSWITP